MFGALLQFVLCFFILIIFGIWVSLALCSVIVHVHIWNSGIPSAFRRAVYNHFINLNFTTGDMHGVSFTISNLLIMVFWWYFLLCNLFHVIYCVVLCFALIVFVLCTLYCQFDCPFFIVPSVFSNVYWISWFTCILFSIQIEICLCIFSCKWYISYVTFYDRRCIFKP